jgi:hypothetical protein
MTSDRTATVRPARVRFLTTAEGGRISPASPGTRSELDLGDTQTSCIIADDTGREIFPPGEDVTVQIKVIFPWVVKDFQRLRKVRLYEGSRLVAVGDFVDQTRTETRPASGKTVELSEDEALAVYRVLNEVVVSLGRISSRESGGEDPEGRYLSGYFSEDGATLRLAEARRVINDAVERSFSEAELDAVDDGIIYWTDRHPAL